MKHFAVKHFKMLEIEKMLLLANGNYACRNLSRMWKSRCCKLSSIWKRVWGPNTWVEEERLNRIKHAPRMAPRLAIDYCLKQAGVKLEQVDYVAVGFDSAMHSAFGNLCSEKTSFPD